MTGELDQIDIELLAGVIAEMSMQWFWYEEPRQLHDPPNMKRMSFNHEGYAHSIAEEYNRRVRVRGGYERTVDRG